MLGMLRRGVILVAALTLPLTSSIQQAGAVPVAGFAQQGVWLGHPNGRPTPGDSCQQSVVSFYGGMQGVHAIAAKADIRGEDPPGYNEDLAPDGYVLPGTSVESWVALGPAGTPCSSTITDMYFQVVCNAPDGTPYTWTGPVDTSVVTVPGNQYPEQGLAYPTLFPSGEVKIPGKCPGTATGILSDGAPNTTIYFCWTGVTPKTAEGCNSEWAAAVLPSTVLPGPAIPTGSGNVTMYEWVSKAELKYIKSHGQFSPVGKQEMGLYFYDTYGDAEKAETLYKGYTLIKATIAGPGVDIDYSVSIAGLDSAGAYFLEGDAIAKFFDIIEVAG
jgi:hypothetical protein